MSATDVKVTRGDLGKNKPFTADFLCNENAFINGIINFCCVNFKIILGLKIVEKKPYHNIYSVVALMV